MLAPGRLSWVEPAVLRPGGMTENDRLRARPLADQLRIAAVDLTLTGAPRELVVACWRAAEGRVPQPASAAASLAVASRCDFVSLSR
jgi:hypothetical protein